MNQRQCKRYRKAIKKMEKDQMLYWEIVRYMGRRPPMWRVIARIKWEREGRKFYDAR